MQPYGVQYNYFDEISTAAASGGAHDVVARIQEFLREFRQTHPQAAVRLDTSLIADWVRHDIGEMIQVLKEHGTPFLLQMYCPHRDLHHRKEDNVIREVAREGGYPLSDTATER